MAIRAPDGANNSFWFDIFINRNHINRVFEKPMLSVLHQLILQWIILYLDQKLCMKFFWEWVPRTLERPHPQIEFHPLIISLAAGAEKIRRIHHSPEVENTERTSENTQLMMSRIQGLDKLYRTIWIVVAKLFGQIGYFIAKSCLRRIHTNEDKNTQIKYFVIVNHSDLAGIGAKWVRGLL